MLDLLRSEPPFFAVCMFVLGLAVGSFLNVVIHRLPRMLERAWFTDIASLFGERGWQSPAALSAAMGAGSGYNLVAPRSACPACGHRIRPIENIPVLSYLWLRGRCSACRAPISVRYPVVEMAAAVLSAAVAVRFGFSLAAAAAVVLLWALLALSLIDFDTQLLPDSITLPLVWAGLAFNLFGALTDLRSAVLGAMAGYLVLWSVYWLFKLATGREGMGFGDFKLLSALGAFLGWQLLPVIVLLSSLVGAVVGGALILLARRGREVPMPFGPYLACAGAVALFAGQEITRAYLELL
ncbi:MAG: prepilin peptidase [Burkholderiales bacterium]|nr:prepilin peptidase [Burkholderiales bacterium]